jgi:hypothetical protein
MIDVVYLVQEGETLTVRTTKPADPLPDAWPPSQAWPEGAWLPVPIDKLDAVLVVHMSETHSAAVNRKRGASRSTPKRVKT